MQRLAATWAQRLDDARRSRAARRVKSSVRAALAAVPERCQAVFVHDGARPLVQVEDVRSGMELVKAGVASLLATPVVDTVKVVAQGGRAVERTLERAELWAAQTPQFATLADLRRAHEAARTRARRGDRRRRTARADRCLGARRSGERRELQGNAARRSRSGRDDLARALLAGTQAVSGAGRSRLRRAPARRGRPFVLGGVRIPFERGPLGHSDADVLGARDRRRASSAAARWATSARIFPDSDVRWKGADSMRLLEECARMARARGYEIGNVDATVVVEAPKLAPHLAAMRGAAGRGLAHRSGCG